MSCNKFVPSIQPFIAGEKHSPASIRGYQPVIRSKPSASSVAVLSGGLVFDPAQQPSFNDRATLSIKIGAIGFGDEHEEQSREFSRIR